MKSNWVKKYLREVPGIIVIFSELDWNDSEWVEKKNQLTAKVQDFRYCSV